MMRVFPVLAIVAGVVLLAWLGWTFYVRFSTEQLSFRVLEKTEAFEIRSYGPHLVAYVDVIGDYETAINAGFRILAGYIFGGNTGRENIPMAAPVTEFKNERIGMTAPVTEQESGEFHRIQLAIIFPVIRNHSLFPVRISCSSFQSRLAYNIPSE